ncbi:hypothetical protein F5887DRAFT_1072535 [Amanita rubescens]|nr:hypothetical protein F5887DRAFT_1072535 [Amanita rubescens]
MSSGTPSSDAAEGQGYPEQLHAGKVGLGPNYPTGPDLSEKMVGLYEEAKGKLFNKPELVAQGRGRRTGETQTTELERGADVE